MLAISIMIEGQDGLTWPRWKQLVADVEALGFAGLFRSDHWIGTAPPDEASLELVVSLAYLADHTERIHFGPLVAPVSFRDPVLLARQAAALDDLSGGRCILGLGAGWMEREHALFGYELGPIGARLDRLEEALDVVRHLWGPPEATAYDGRYYRLGAGATILPRSPRAPGPRILIGGSGPKRTLPLVARYADIWNTGQMDGATFQQRSALLDSLLLQAGRQPGDVRRTIMRTVFWGRDLEEIGRRFQGRHPLDAPAFPGQPLEAVIATMAGKWKLAGTSQMIIEQLASYAAAGVDEVMLRWIDFDDREGLRLFAESVLPYV